MHVAFNDLFSNVAYLIDYALHTTTSLSLQHASRSSDYFVIIGTTTDEVKRSIFSFIIKNSPLNVIPTYAFKIIEPVSIGIFPSCLKTARVLPNFESG